MTRVSALVATTAERQPFYPLLALHIAASGLGEEDEVVIAAEDAQVADAIEGELRDLGHPRPEVRFVRVPRQPREVPVKRNRLMAEARGEFFCWLDDDDFHDPDWLGDSLRVLETQGRIWVLWRGLRYVDLVTGKTWVPRSWTRSPSMGTLVARTHVARTLPFDETLERGSDTHWKTWAQDRWIGHIASLEFDAPQEEPRIVALRHGANMSTWLHRPEVVPRNALQARYLPELYPTASGWFRAYVDLVGRLRASARGDR